jgi:hypothetical protein
MDMNRLLNNPLMVFVYIFLAVAGVFVGLTLGGPTYGIALAITLAFGFVLVFAAIEIIYRRKVAGDPESTQDFSPIQSTVIVGGKVVENFEELPGEVKTVFQQLLQDADADGILDFLQSSTAKEGKAGVFEEDRVHQMQEAKQMLESGLITRDEYQATVKQIMNTK